MHPAVCRPLPPGAEALTVDDARAGFRPGAPAFAAMGAVFALMPGKPP